MSAPERRTLPRRDWIILPALALLTVMAMLGAAEGGTQVLWPEQKTEPCLAGPGKSRPHANCVSRSKAAEGPWVENRYNDCGYRATGPCQGPESDDRDRIVVMGSSTSWAYLVPFDKGWSVTAAKTLAAQCGHPVDIQSLSGFNNLNMSAQRIGEALALKPKLVALVVAPFDLLEAPVGGFNPAPQPPAAAPVEPPAEPNLLGRAKAVISGSRAATVAQHYLFQNADVYVAAYMRYGDKADFMRTPLTPAWQARLKYLDDGIGYLADRLKPQGVSFMVVYAPQQAQAALVAEHTRLAGVDATQIDREIAAIATKHGAIFADGSSGFSGVAAPASYFYNTDGHLNSSGQQLLGRVAAQALLAAKPATLCPAAGGATA